MGRRDFPIRLLVGVLVLYGILVGGTFNGVVNVLFSQTTLILLTIAVPVWLVFRWRRGWAWHGTILDWALLVGAGAAILATLANFDAGRRVTIGLWYWGMYLALWLLLVDLLTNGMPERWLLDGIIATGVPVVLIGFWQTGGWLAAWRSVTSAGIAVPFIPLRPGSVIGNPNALGTFLVVLVPLLLSRLVQARRVGSRIGWSTYGLLAVGLLALTLSRGAWLALAAALGMWLLIALWAGGLLSWRVLGQRWLARSRLWQGGMIGLGVVVIVAGLAIAPALVSAVNQPGRTIDTREAIWGAALDAFAEQPVTGTGPFTFGRTLLAHQSTPPDTPHSHVHDLVLQVATETGLPGLVALIAGLALVSTGLWRRIRRQQTLTARLEMAACIAALVGFGVHHLLDMTMMMPSITFLAILTLASALIRLEDSEPANRPGRVSARGIAAIGLWGVLLVSGWWSQSIQADYMQALLKANEGDWMAGAADLESVVVSDPGVALYAAEQGYVLGIAAAQGEPDAAEAGIAAFERALAVEDVYAPWWANLAALRWEDGDEAGALRAMQAALDRAPRASELWLTQATYYEAMGDVVSAEAAYLQALELKPRWYPSSFWEGSEVRTRALSEFVEANPQEVTRLDTALEALYSGDPGEAQQILLASPELGRASVGERVVLALSYELQEDSIRSDLWLQSADLALQYPWDMEWLYVGQAILADWRGERQAEATLRVAQYELYGNPRGSTYPNGQNLSWAQFMRDAIPEQLLPQIASLPDFPQAAQLLAWALDQG